MEIKGMVFRFFLQKKVRTATGLLLLAVTGAGIVSEVTTSPSCMKKNDAPGRGVKSEIETASVTCAEIDDLLEVTGQIVFREKVSLSSKVSGRISKIYIREGQRVSRGQPVAQIERMSLEIALRQQKAELEIARRKFELAQARHSDALKSVEIKLRTIKKAEAEAEDCRVSYENMDNILKNKTALFRAGGVSATELRSVKARHMSYYTKYRLAKTDLDIQNVGYRDRDIKEAGYSVPKSEKKRAAVLRTINTRIEKAEMEAAGAGVKQALGNVRSTELMLKETVIVSPINGIVAAKNMEAGEMAGDDSVIATVMDINTVYVSMNVSERDIPGLRKGMRVSFTADALKKRSYSGRVETICPVLDVKTRTAEVRAPVRNRDMSLLPGMFVRAFIERGEKVRAVLIPSGAPAGEGGNEVYLARKGILVKQRIVKGREHGGMTEVKEGLQEGDRVVVKGLETVYEGMKVPDDGKAVLSAGRK